MKKITHVEWYIPENVMQVVISISENYPFHYNESNPLFEGYFSSDESLTDGEKKKIISFYERFPMWISIFEKKSEIYERIKDLKLEPDKLSIMGFLNENKNVICFYLFPKEHFEAIEKKSQETFEKYFKQFVFVSDFSFDELNHEFIDIEELNG